ncbi:MAG: hypothetical protein AAB830_01085 [Patescibacteria group bacterium]
MTNIEGLGIASAFLTLSAFVANEYGKLTTESFWYDFINFVSAVGLGFYAYSIGAIPFIITNSVWGLVSGIDVIKYIFGMRNHRRHRHLKG